MQLTLLATRLAIVRFPPESPIPKWVPARGFVSITQTDDELSIICDDAKVPASERAERGWIAMRVSGPLDFSLTGILAALAVPLAEAKVPIFAISTYETDYVLVKGENLAGAVRALRESGHTVGEATP
ncbi:MAG: ACT domain-containing protein [Thermoanaerobaculia bacterium]